MPDLVNEKSLRSIRSVSRDAEYPIYVIDDFFTDSFYRQGQSFVETLDYHRKENGHYGVWALEGRQEGAVGEACDHFFSTPIFCKFLAHVYDRPRALSLACYEWLCLRRGESLPDHTDATESRTVQAVFYFNSDWRGRDGGLLEISDVRRQRRLAAPLVPRGNRLVLFAVDANHVHRVTTVVTRRSRYCLSLSYR